MDGHLQRNLAAAAAELNISLVSTFRYEADAEQTSLPTYIAFIRKLSFEGLPVVSAGSTCVHVLAACENTGTVGTQAALDGPAKLS